MNWIFLSLLSAFFAGVTATVSKIGLKNVDSNVGFAIQSVVILLLTWGYIGVSGKSRQLTEIEPKAWGWLLLSGVITTLAYLAYFAAIKAGDVSRVAPLDRLSLVFAIVFAVLFLGDKINGPTIFGASLMAIGALIIGVAGASK